MITIRKILLCLLALFTVGSALAQQGASSTVLYAVDGQGMKHKVRAFVYKNDWNRNEVRLEAADVPRISPGVNQLLGFGRDFDDDGKIETWFMWDSDKGFVRHTIPGNHVYGHDVIQTKLFKVYSTSLLTKANVLASNLLAYLSLAASKAVNSQVNFFKEMLDFEEIGYRLDHGQSMGLHKLSPAQTARMRILLREGYRRSLDVLNRANNQEFLALLAADVAIWLSGGIIVKYIGKGIKIAGTLLVKTAAGAQIKAIFSAILSKSMNFIARSMTRLQQLAGAAMSALQINAAKSIAAKSLKSALYLIGRGLGIRGKLARAAVVLRRAHRRGGTKWTFMAASMGAGMWGDLYAESLRKDESTKLALAVANSPQMQNDIVACVMGGRQPKGTQVEYQIAGVINVKTQRMTMITDEGVTNMAVDIGTKLTIDSAKDTMDGVALNYVENIVTETRQPKLILVGYVAIIANEITSGSVKRKIQGSVPVLCPIKVEG